MIMCELARSPGKIIPLSGLAKKLKISSIYLIQIARPLLAADLLKSREGALGGYTLAKPAGKISVLEIFEALDGEIVSRCKSDGKKCPHCGTCKQRNIWEVLLADLKKGLAKKSLASLLAMSK